MNVNRRSAVKTIGTLGITGTLISRESAGQTRKRKALALFGDGAHKYEMIHEAIEKNIAQETDISIDFTKDTSVLNPSTLAKYQILINARGYIRGVTTDKRTEMARTVQTFVKNGGGILLLHNSTGLARSTGTPIFRDIVGGHWLQHSGNLAESVSIRPYRVRITNNEHPITQGVKDFVVTGEHHYNQYDKDPRHVFLRNETIDGWAYNNIKGDPHYDERLGDRGFGPSCPSGWAYDYGKGRVCFMAQGHTLEEYMNEEFRKLQKNGALWVLKQL